MERPVRKPPNGKEERSYFLAPSPTLKFVSTGCTVLDCILGGGWVLGRIGNIIGDEATGKTLLAMEAYANFARMFPNGRMWYDEAEHAWDEDYANALGMPVKRIKLLRAQTVEDFQEHVRNKAIILKNNNTPGMFTLDSLDALSDRKELSREVGQDTYGGDKAKQMSQLFRKVVSDVEASQMGLIIVSQTRSNIGVTFGRKWRVSGGEALKFYASQRLHIAHAGDLYKTVRGQKRTIGSKIRAKCIKSKVGMPHRTCDFLIRYGYGIDDLYSCTQFLKENDSLKLAGIDTKTCDRILRDTNLLKDDEFKGMLAEAKKCVVKLWPEIESSFLPTRKKY